VELLEKKGLAFAPDAVVVLFTENDFHNLNRDLYRWREARRPGWVGWAFPRSALFRVVALRLDLWGLASQLDPTAAMRGTEDNLVVDAVARLAELADREGFAPLVAIWPRFENARITDANALPGKLKEGPRELVIERLAAMHGVESVRLSPAFRRDWRARGKEGGNPAAFYTLADGLHPNAGGAALAARGLDEALAGIAQRPRPAPVRRPDDEQIAERSRTLGAAFEARALERAAGLR
jgi:lysophospholipase L1-like esterase